MFLVLILLLLFASMAILFLFEVSPLVMAIILTFLAILVGLLSGALVSKWVGLSLILIFVGGMMVSFLYVSSLSSNFKIQSSVSTAATAFLAVALSVSQMHNAPPLQATTIAPGVSYSSLNAASMVFLVLLLLIALLVATKLTESFKGALVKKF